MRLLVLGLDGLDYHLARDTGILTPEFRLHSMFSPVPVTGPAWASIYTGKPVEEHGVTNVWGLPEEDSLTLLHVQEDCIWRALNRRGFSTGLANMPLTHPDMAVDPGFLIAGFPYNEDPAYDMVNWFGARGLGVGGWPRPFASLPLKEVLYRSMAGVGTVLADFVVRDQGKVDCGFIQFSFVDRIGHTRPLDDEGIGLIYGAAQTVISLTRERLAPVHTVVLSDHGFSLRASNHTEDFEAVFAHDIPREDLPEVKAVTDIFRFISAYFAPQPEEAPPREGPPPLRKPSFRERIEQKLRALGYLEED